jgi:outer membrane murein-binding lipoprotein Lpp
MMDEQGARFAVLLEDMDRKLGLLAEASASHGEKLTSLEHTLNQRIDQLDVKFVGMAIEIRTKVNELGTKVDKLETKVDKLEVFAIDAAPRLERIEHHLALNKPLPRHETTRTAPSKHHRRRPAKRT